jgi:hypothetical protein
LPPKNYKLYARDVAVLPLTAQLVTISTCKSAGAKAYSSEGSMGFAWAFCRRIAERVGRGRCRAACSDGALCAEMRKGQTHVGAPVTRLFSWASCARRR